MVMGLFSRPHNETEKNVQQGKNPIVLSLCLMTDILILGLSFSLLLLIGLNMPKSDQTEALPSTEKIMSHLSDVMVLSLFATFFTLTTSMFAVIYSSTILFGSKYNWPCCPGLKNKIKYELLGSPIDEKDANSRIV